MSFRKASVWLYAGGAVVLHGCSFGTVRPVDCTSNLECRDAFGLGSVCGEEGLCETTEMHPRCDAGIPADLVFPIDPAETLMIGTLFDHSLDTHIGRYRSAQLAVQQANANGGLDGVQFGILHCSITENPEIDALTKTEASVELGIWLADAVGVPAIVGPAASSDTEAVYNAVARDFGTLIVSPSATSPSLTPLDGSESSDGAPGLLWRTAPPDSLQGFAIAQDMQDNYGELDVRTEPSRKVAVIYQTGAYGEGLQATFSEAMRDLGGTTTLLPFDSAVGSGEQIGAAGNGDYDEVLFISSEATDVADFLLGAKGVNGFLDLPIFLTDAARNADVLADSEDADILFDQIRGTAPANPTGAVFDTFAASYAQANGGADVKALSYTAQAFDAAWLVIYGHAWATYREGGVINGTTLARGLRRVSNGPDIDIVGTKWNEVKDHFRNGESIDVYGASGALDYDSVSEETTAVIDVWVIDPSTGAFQTVDNFNP